MYSAVLMLALTAGSESADFGRNRCHGGTTGCTTVVATSYSCASSCHARTPLFGNRGHGCTASHGCTTTYAAPACSASHGCTASHGCHGGLFSRNRGGCSSSYGCTTSYSCTGGVIIEKKAMPMEKKGEDLKVKPKGQAQISAPATIVVSLPADARLTVDGASTNSVSARRTLITPELAVGATYVYTMRAEVVRDGRTVAMDQQVTVRGGETSTIEFQFANQGVASR